MKSMLQFAVSYNDDENVQCSFLTEGFRTLVYLQLARKRAYVCI
jgi:hypothetical protein